MDTVWTQLGLVAFLILVNASLSGTEMALVSLRDSQIARLAERGPGGRALASLAEDPNAYLATIQIGITLAGFLASATAAVSLAEPLVAPLETVIGGAASAVSVFAVTIVLTFATLVLGELAPKRIAMHRTEGWALAAARPLSLLSTATKPIVWLLGVSTDLVARLAGIDPDASPPEISEEELRDMVASQPELTDVEREIIDGAFEFADRTLHQIIVPRTNVVSLAARTPAGEAARLLAAAGHTRAPVHEGDLDDVIGTVHLRDLVDSDETVGALAQRVLVLPETVGCLNALRSMQAERQQMVIVIDEHGATQGIVTVEDLVEELVGDIWDEADPDVQSVIRHEDGSMTLDGAYPVHDLVDIGVDLPEGPYTTVGGLIMATLERIPDEGDEVLVGGWRFLVDAASDRTVDRVTAVPATAETDGHPDPRYDGRRH